MSGKPDTEAVVNAISINNLSFRYKDQKDVKAIKGINLDISKGQFVVVMGASGAGKSTLANCLNGLIPHFIIGEYEGNVSINNVNVKDSSVSKMSKEVGLVFQDFESQLFSTNTKLEIAFGPENFNVEKEEIQKRIENVVRTVKLEGLENRSPATLSGGQKQRLAIGAVLAVLPGIVCMDEATTDLDPVGKLEIFNISKKLRRDKKVTLIMFEHETEEALQADRLIIMENGEIIRDGKPQEVLREIDMTDRTGITSLQIPKYFKEVASIDMKDLPLTPDEGCEQFSHIGLEIDDDKYDELLQRDKNKEMKYGDMLINVKNLQHTYPNGNRALKGIDLEIKEGEFLAILGHNGSGKTTLVKHLNGLLEPTGGTVEVKGKDTKQTSVFEIGKDVGYVFQNPDHQIFSDTVYDEVAFSPKTRGCSKEEIDIRVKEALEAVDMAGYEEEDPFSLTKGERQRVAVASVLSAKPQVIILDEPTTGLDYKGQKKMMELIKKLNENEHTVIMITHTMWVVAEYAHKVAVIKDGEMTMYGSTRNIFKEEKILLDSCLKTPAIVSLSNKLGKTVLSVDEMAQCTKGVK